MSAANTQSKKNELAQAMPEELFAKAVEVLKIPSTGYNETSMALYICRQLEMHNIDYHIDGYGNILVTKGESEHYPCFCAHLDTVHQYKDGFNLYYATHDEHTYLYAEDDEKIRVGIGGDDKCGIFVCLHLLEVLPCVKVVFFSQEESGGIGSNNVNLEFFANCRFLGGIDRWNGSEFINRYSGDYTISKRMHNTIKDIRKRYGLEYSSGLFTDSFNVMERGIDISCFNLSCGYYAHHSSSEYVDVNELYNTCLVCEELARIEEVFKHKIPVKTKSYYGYSGSSEYGGKYGRDLNDYNWKNSNRWGNDGWTYDGSTGAWTRKYDKSDIKRDISPTAAAPYGKCCMCGIELFQYEKTYCTSCKGDWNRWTRNHSLDDMEW